MAKGRSGIGIHVGKMDFYKYYLGFIKPIHPINKLKNKQLEVLAVLMYERAEIESKISDPSLIPKLLLSSEVKEKILKQFHLSSSNYYGIISCLKRMKVIVDNDLSKKVIPEVVDGKFVLTVSFTVEDET